MEAIAYLATLGSHRVSTDAPLVRQGTEHAVIRARVREDERSVSWTCRSTRVDPTKPASITRRLPKPQTS